MGRVLLERVIYSSELDRGFDIYELTPSAQLSANEIAAAKLVTMKEYNPQSQPKLTWPPAFVVVRSYLDQLVRNDGLANDKTSAISKSLEAAEKQSGAARADRVEQARRRSGRRCEGRQGFAARENDGVGNPSSCGGVEVTAGDTGLTNKKPPGSHPGAFRFHATPLRHRIELARTLTGPEYERATRRGVRSSAGTLAGRA